MVPVPVHKTLNETSVRRKRMKPAGSWFLKYEVQVQQLDNNRC